MTYRKHLARFIILLCFTFLMHGFCLAAAKADSSPVILVQPQSVMVPDGSTASVSITATGTGLTYQWYRKSFTEPAFTAAGVTTPTYSITMTKESSGQHVYCVVTDAMGNSVNSGFAVLNCSDAGITFPVELTDERVDPGKNYYLRVNTEGPAAGFAWYSSVVDFDEFRRYSSWNNDGTKNYISHFISSNSIQYNYCVVTGANGYAVSTNIIKVSTNEPKIISCSEGNLYCSIGDTVTLFVEAEGDNLNYLWKSYSSNSSLLPDYDERSKPTLTLTMTEELDNLMIYCEIWDSNGNKLKTPYAYIHLPKLQIIKDPEDTSIVAGMNAILHVEATGTEIRYLWYYRFENEEYVRLPCTEPELSIKLTKPGDYEVYCEIMDKSGQKVISYAAQVEVFNPIFIEEDITSKKVRHGEDVKLNFWVQGCDVQYQWYCREPGSSTFVPLEDKKSFYCYFPMTSAVHGRKLYCVATDKAGNTVTSATVTASMDTSLLLLGDCTVCGGDGNCDRCYGYGEYEKLVIIGGKHEFVTVDCDSPVCYNGSCAGCGGDGWVGSKNNYVPGDADSNKRVNLADVLLVMQYDAGWDVSPHKQTADTNANGAITVEDALMILLNIADRNK